MRGRLEQRIEDFSHGVHRRTSSHPGTDPTGKDVRALLDANDMTYAKSTGTMRWRNRHNTIVDMPSNTTHSLFGAVGLPAGQPTQLIIGEGTDIKSYSTPAGLSAAISAGMTGTGLSIAQGPTSGGQGPVYITDGTNVRYYTGAAAGNWTAAVGTHPVPFYIIWQGTRMWAARCTALGGVLSDQASGIAWSEIGDPRNWPAANVTMFDPGDGDRLTCIGRVGPYLLVFKRAKTWLIYDLDTSANRQLSSQIGCIGPRAIAETPHGTYFMSNQGLAVCDGSTIKLVEDKLNLVRGFIAPLFTIGLDCCLVYYDDRLYFTLGTGAGGPGFGGVLYEYDIANDAWWPATSTSCAQLAVWPGNANGNLQIWGNRQSGLTPQLGTLFASANNTDWTPGVLLASTFTLPLIDFGTDRRKRIRAVTVEGLARATTSFYPDKGAAPIAGLTFNIENEDPSGRAIIPRPETLAPLRRLRLKFTVNNVPIIPLDFDFQAVTIHADLMTN